MPAPLLLSAGEEHAFPPPFPPLRRLFADHWIGSIGLQQERCLAAQRAAAAPRYMYLYDYPTSNQLQPLPSTPPSFRPPSRPGTCTPTVRRAGGVPPTAAHRLRSCRRRGGGPSWDDMTKWTVELEGKRAYCRRWEHCVSKVLRHERLDLPYFYKLADHCKQ